MSGALRRNERVLRVASGFVIGFTIVLVIAPALLTILLSFSDDAAIGFPPKSWGVQNYVDLFSSTKWLDPLMLSLQLSVGGAVIALVLGVPTLLALHRSRVPFRGAIEGWSLVSMILPGAVYAVAMYGVFQQFGLNGTHVGLMLMYGILAVPMVVILGSAALRQISQELELVAYTLGARRFRALFGVTLRLVLPAMLASALMAFITGFEEAVFINFLGGPGLKTLPKAISDSVMYGSDPTITAISAILVVATSIAIALPMALSREEKRT
ncbi:ABC transporter permease [Leucobacter rhizosphaerae]|uniref:ABC transporter permease n=1 Tax=Leucobacter rhizosphaerae TaxID=2932245 RepID=A0ABY4FRT0_9MICO|nr:ABC transporter permease [Leucobacter rhizosphaerae]UOQ58957.1 ABC transporter permease [Leucobacter rhizosphaerae]